jgi:hypothetical protein
MGAIMKRLGKISLATMLLSVSVSAQAEFERVGRRFVKSSTVSALPKVLNAPVIIKAGNAVGKFTLETDLFLASCGLVKTSMPNVSSADILATVSALQSQDDIPGSLVGGREFMREELANGAVTCRIDNVEEFTFFVNGCSSFLAAEIRVNGAVLEGQSTCEKAFSDFAKN